VPLRGVIPPLVTPFTADGALDLPAFEANLEALVPHDLAGFLVLGSNGEAASLDDETVFRLTRERLAAGVCKDLGDSERDTEEFRRRAGEVAILLRSAGVPVRLDL
jgi:hypothetical protein